MSWPPLIIGDKVEVIAPSYGATEDEFNKVAEYLDGLGLKHNIPANICDDDLFCSNSEEYRFLHLKKAIEDEGIKAIWCMRGGYGAAQIIPMLDSIEKPEEQKLFIGFSDATAIHIFLNQSWDWSTIHGPMLRQISEKEIDEESINTIQGVVFGNTKEINIDDLQPLNELAEQPKDIEAVMSGGNLSLIQTSLQTEWEIDPAGKIFFIEDTDEKSYSYHRMLTHIKQSGILNGALAIIVGAFDHHSDEDERVEQMIKDFAAGLELPVLQTNKIGHSSTNLPVPLNTKAKLTLGKKPLLNIECS